MRKLTGFDVLLRKLSGLFNERALRLNFLSGSVRVSELQFPQINDMVRDGAYILDLPQIPEVFVTQDSRPNCTLPAGWQLEMTTARLPIIVSAPTASGILRVERMSITSAAMSVSAAPTSPSPQPPGITYRASERRKGYDRHHQTVSLDA